MTTMTCREAVLAAAAEALRKGDIATHLRFTRLAGLCTK